MNDDYILQDILDRLRTTFGIESPLSNGSERLRVLVSLLGIYDSNWFLESLPVRIGYHGEMTISSEEPHILNKEDCNTLKRWLQRLDLGYLVGSKRIEDFCAMKKKCHHLLSVLMDKIEQHHGMTKLKSNIRVMIQKQSRMKVRSSSLNLTKRKVSPCSSSYDGSAMDEKSFEEIFHGTQIPRTPAKSLSPDNPNAEDDTNKTYDIANELSITPLTFVKDFEDLPYDNSNKRSSHYRRSSFDKNIIPTGRQIPNTPTQHSKSPSDSINETYTIADQSKDTSISNLDKSAKISNEQQPPVSSKRRRSPSRDRMTNYALDEPESGTIWDDECDEFHIRRNVKDINWESTFSSNKTTTFDDEVSDKQSESVIHEAPDKDLNNSFKKLNLNEQDNIKTKPSRTRRKKVSEEKKSEGTIEDANNGLAKTSRVSRRKKALPSTKECSSTGIESDAKEEPKKPKSRTKKGSNKVSDNELVIDQTSTLPDEDKSIRRVKRGGTTKLSDKENSDPIIDDSKNRSKNDVLPSVCDVEKEGEEGRVLRRSTRTRKANVKYDELSKMNDVTEENTIFTNNESTPETKKRVTRKKKTTTKSVVQDEVSILNDPPKKRGSRKKAEASQVL